MSNCLFYAIRQWWKRGGYIIARRSHYGWWPHFLWSADLQIFEQYTTDEKTSRRIPPLLFRGYVKADTVSTYKSDRSL